VTFSWCFFLFDEGTIRASQFWSIDKYATRRNHPQLHAKKQRPSCGREPRVTAKGAGPILHKTATSHM
jgi:hypothetical protein